LSCIPRFSLFPRLSRCSSLRPSPAPLPPPPPLGLHQERPFSEEKRRCQLLIPPQPPCPCPDSLSSSRFFSEREFGAFLLSLLFDAFVYYVRPLGKRGEPSSLAPPFPFLEVPLVVESWMRRALVPLVFSSVPISRLFSRYLPNRP